VEWDEMISSHSLFCCFYSNPEGSGLKYRAIGIEMEAPIKATVFGQLLGGSPHNISMVANIIATSIAVKLNDINIFNTLSRIAPPFLEPEFDPSFKPSSAAFSWYV
jgi:hypothetical protein